MPKINVYLPDELAAAVKEANIPVSAICQTALERAVRDVAATRAAAEDVDDEELEVISARGNRFARFTPRARGSVVAAQKLARTRGDSSVGTEHVLLGIIEEGNNLALGVLAALDIDPEDVKSELEASMPAAGKEKKGKSHIAFEKPAKDALQVAMREALGLGHNYIGCEHLLLGVLAVDDALASRVLRRMGVELRTTRRTVITLLSGYMHAKTTMASATAPAEQATLEQIVRRLDAIEQRLSD
jgi:ATP-dependent Clp protease ATP-binding subunit ClpC